MSVVQTAVNGLTETTTSGGVTWNRQLAAGCIYLAKAREKEICRRILRRPDDAIVVEERPAVPEKKLDKKLTAIAHRTAAMNRRR